MATTIENITDTTANKAQDFTADMTGRAQDAMAKTQALFSDWTSFNKGNLEAMVESGKLAVAGMQTMAQDQAAYVRKHFEEASPDRPKMSAVDAIRAGEVDMVFNTPYGNSGPRIDGYEIRSAAVGVNIPCVTTV